jgi:hypothetical protein
MTVSAACLAFAVSRRWYYRWWPRSLAARVTASWIARMAVLFAAPGGVARSPKAPVRDARNCLTPLIGREARLRHTLGCSRTCNAPAMMAGAIRAGSRGASRLAGSGICRKRFAGVSS